MFHAWFCASLMHYGTSIYARADGTEVEVTEVIKVSPEEEGIPERMAKADDAMYRGIVEKYVRVGVKHPTEFTTDWKKGGIPPISPLQYRGGKL